LSATFLRGLNTYNGMDTQFVERNVLKVS